MPAAGLLLPALLGLAAADVDPGLAPALLRDDECTAGDAACNVAIGLLQTHSSGGEKADGPDVEEKCGPALARTPQEYRQCWDERRLCCVAADLYGHPVAHDAPDDTQMYGAGYMQWITGFTNLEAALRLRRKYGDSPMVSLGYQVNVGFNPIYLWSGGHDLLIFKLKNESVKASVFAPTWAEWFHFFHQRTGVEFSHEVVREILDAYTTIGQFDVVSAWSKLTGCSRHCSAPVNSDSGDIFVTRECGCDKGVVSVHEKLAAFRQANPYNIDCIQELFRITTGSPTPGQVRVAFAVCENMLPVFTGFGLGYNTIVSPLKCRGPLACTYKPMDRTTGREFVLRNMPIKDTVETATVERIFLSELPGKAWVSQKTVAFYC